MAAVYGGSGEMRGFCCCLVENCLGSLQPNSLGCQALSSSNLLSDSKIIPLFCYQKFNCSVTHVNDFSSKK